jgi:hypothetical protein
MCNAARIHPTGAVTQHGVDALTGEPDVGQLGPNAIAGAVQQLAAITDQAPAVDPQCLDRRGARKPEARSNLPASSRT